MSKETNNHLCAYKGYKLSSIDTSMYVATKGGYFSIGSDVDDTDNPYRVDLEVIGTDAPNGHELSVTNIDLEQLLIFARKYCSGIYERVYKGHKACKE